MGQRKIDPTWKHTSVKRENGTNYRICIYCGEKTYWWIARAKEHFIGGEGNRKNTLTCSKAPSKLKEELLTYVEKTEASKQAASMEYIPPDFDEDLVETEEEDDCHDIQVIGEDKGKGKDVSTDSSNGNRNTASRKWCSPTGGMTSTASISKVQSFLQTPMIDAQGKVYFFEDRKKKAKTGGAGDKFFQADPELKVKKRKALGQLVISENFGKQARDDTIQDIARWFYQARIPLHSICLDSFKVMVESIGRYGPGLKVPSYHELEVSCLKNQRANIEELMENHKKIWSLKGCSLILDVWTDRRVRTFINFLVNSSAGTIFIESVEVGNIKTETKILKLLDKMVERIGEENVVQVMFDNHSRDGLAGEHLEAKRPHLFWTPCAAHCLNLMLENIDKLPPTVMKTLARARELADFIYEHSFVLDMMREFTKQRELQRPAVTKFAKSFFTLLSIHKQKNELRSMFTSEKWLSCKWAKGRRGRRAARIVMIPSFWNDVSYILKATFPIIQVVKLVDNVKKPGMGYIYEALYRAKDAILAALGGNEDKCKGIFDIIYRRWVKLHRPLHAAAHFLNPEIFYANPAIYSNGEVMKGLYDVIQRLSPNEEIQDKIEEEFSMYKRADGLFGHPIAIRSRTKKAPAEWWESFGGSAPHLQQLAIRVLSLTCSVSGCERSWSVFERLHSEKWNILEHKRLNDLVFIKYNQALKERFRNKDASNPISLGERGERNKGLFGRKDGDAKNNPSFDGCGRNWGLEEPIAHTKSHAMFASTSLARERDWDMVLEEVDLEDLEETEESMAGYGSLEEDEEEDCLRDDEDDLAEDEDRFDDGEE